MYTTKRIFETNKDLLSFASYAESWVREITIQDVIDKITFKRARTEIGTMVSDTIDQVKEVIGTYC